MSVWTPRERMYRRPDLRGLVRPKLSAQPLPGGDTVDYDDLTIVRSWREYEPGRPDEVRYFVYELSQRDVGSSVYVPFYKVVRFLRVTRVPRYLRQMNSSASGTIFSHQRKLLAGLREQQVLFVNMVAKSPKIPLIFAYGVQATATTVEEAKAEADRSHSVLQHLLDGVYQQLEYTPLKVEEGELLVQYQSEWRHIAMARGRPKPLGADGGTDSYLDGNQTDVENSMNMMESFIRGMGDRSFLMSMVCMPISPYEMTIAWSNLTRTLSDVRSDQSGQRAVNASVALPLSLSSGHGTTDGTSHASAATVGSNASHSLGHTDTHAMSAGVSDSHAVGVTDTHGTSASVGHTDSVSHSVGTSAGQTDSVSASESASHSDTASQSHGTSVGQNHGVSESAATSLGHTNTVGQSATASESQSQSVSQAHGVSSGASLGRSDSSTLSWGSSLSQGNTVGQSAGTTAGLTQGSSLSQATGLTDTNGDGISDSRGTSSGGGINAGLFGAGGGMNSGQNSSFGQNLSHSNALSNTLTSGGSTGSSLSNAWTDSFGQSVTQSEQAGSSRGVGTTATNSVGESLTQTAGQSVGISRGLTDSQSQSLAQTVSQGHGWSAGTSLGQNASAGQSTAVGQSLGVGTGRSVNAGLSEGFGTGSSLSRTDGVSQSQALSQTHSTGTSRSESISAANSQTLGTGASEGASDAYTAAFSRSVQQTAGLGIVPSMGISLSKATFDEGKRVLGDLLEAQMNRYLEGTESGAYLYQMSLICPDRNSLVGAAGLMKAAFWGGGDSGRVVQPFHVSDEFADDEQERLLAHAAAFSTYRKREQSMDLVEPFTWSTYITPGEAAGVTHPPVAEAPGLLVVHDSMPVFAMPADREDRDVYLGWVINGERARVSTVRYGLDLDELTHTLVAGLTGTGKTTMLTRFIYEAVRSSKEVVTTDPLNPGVVDRRDVPAGALIIDWARSFRSLAPVVGAERFRFLSIARPELGRFRFNPLAVPHAGTDPAEWAGMVADQFMVAYALGDFARSIFYDCVHRLYAANRLQAVELAEAVVDPDSGEVLRPAVVLPAIPRDELPPGSIRHDPVTGVDIASVYTFPELSRLVGLTHVAAMVTSMQEALALDPKNRQMSGNSMADRLQTVWRRIMPYAPGNNLAPMVAPDRSLAHAETLRVTDLIDPDRGLVTVLEADGIDIPNRRFLLGSLLMSTWRWGEAAGDGAFDQGGKGPGTFVLLEEAHELFGSQGAGENSESADTRVAIYESMFRRSRKLGMKLIAAVQNPSDVPDAVLGNVGTIVCHRVKTEADKKTMTGLFNWATVIGQQIREVRYLGEMAVGHAIIQTSAKDHYLESAPVHVAVDPPALTAVSDAQLAQLAAWREQQALAGA